ncbi:MAG: YebC/PmpR family DNA-binding transcriptional regulator [Candidatus Peribacteraceae bacterium]|nr:YebC/PmpR family DNA-binding transcriptional regulator [Candidatus Peribacteraceae bacterium]MDD5739336.1 YebC/PmpR family DNA-binding transcriptional regulator [Candidatus Peribacteraceae bacterium]
MSGHSKWANIKVRKTAQDAKRGKIYTRHARLVEMAARGGPDPNMNPSLRTAIDNAKADGVPNANIDRAIKKGSGELKGEQMAVEMYAAYGPGNVAMVIECLTDNKNRTLSSVRSILERRGGRWTESGSVLWMFQQKGVVIGKKPGMKSSDELELQLIDAGAEDIEWSPDTVEVVTPTTQWPKVRDMLKAQGCEVPLSGLKFIPSQKVAVNDLTTAQHLMNLIEAVEEDEDVSEVHTNAEIADEIVSKLE